jgi:hypothetical protein
MSTSSEMSGIPFEAETVVALLARGISTPTPAQLLDASLEARRSVVRRADAYRSEAEHITDPGERASLLQLADALEEAAR